MSEDVDQITRGRMAWQRLQSHQRTAWSDWRAVGEALKIGKDAALKAAGVKTPFGKPYVRIFGNWLRDNGLDEIRSAHRYRLLLCVENIAEIEAWRAGLPERQRDRYNHPDSIWFAFRRDVHGIAPRAVTRPYRPPNPGRAGFHKPSQDLVRIVAAALHKNWTVDTYPLASALLASMREHREEFIEFLTAEPPPPKPAPRRITAPVALELSA